MSMRIAFVRRNWTPTGGAERYLIQLAAGLKNHGNELLLICESWSEKNDLFSDVITIHSGNAEFSKPVFFAQQVNEYFQKNPVDFIFSLERGIRADIYRAGDGIHAEWLEKRADQHPFLSSWWGHLRSAVNLKNKIQVSLEQTTFNPEITKCVIANSEMVKRDILKYFPRFPEDRIKLIRNGVDIQKFSSGNRSEGRKYLGLDESTVLMLLVGAGKERKGHCCARYVEKSLAGKARLFIADRVKDFPMEHLYAAADFFILPAIYDPCSNVVLEAMAAGLPVITTADNGAAEYIEDDKQGFIVRNSCCTDQMIEAAKKLLVPELRKQMGEAARQKIQEWSFERNINETLDLIYKTKGY